MPFSLWSLTLRNPMLRGGIIFRPLNRPQFALTGNAAFELRAHFIGAPLLLGFGATDREPHRRGQRNYRQEFHLLSLGRAVGIAIRFGGAKRRLNR